jgi:hypothetical protein
VINEHLDAFLETARRHADGASLPTLVEREFRDFLTCGVLTHGFARLRCSDCSLERLVPFSCKGARLLPELRRAAHDAARLIDEVPLRVPRLDHVCRDASRAERDPAQGTLPDR